ncbi:hypothetical protein FDZ36_22350 [Salmonella enterica]|nr:hypothetical protein [Salmonella enterica]EJN3866569.1 hypothetical protein [Salmonella enterica]
MQTTHRGERPQSASRRVQLRGGDCAGIELEPLWNLVEPHWNRLGTLKILYKSTMEPWNLLFIKSNQKIIRKVENVYIWV